MRLQANIFFINNIKSQANIQTFRYFELIDKIIKIFFFIFLSYEMLIGIPPFYHHNHNVMFQLIVEKELKFPSSISISENAKDLISKLLAKNPQLRLRDADLIKLHPWFNEINFDDLLNKKVFFLFLKKNYIYIYII